MGLTARVPSAADTAGFVPEQWSQKIIDAAENQLPCWDAFDTDRWRSDLKFGDTINIGVTNHVTATEVVVGTKASSLDIATGSKLTIVVNQWYEAPVDVDYMTLKQSQLDWPTQTQKEAAYAIAKNMDSYINSLFSSLGGYSTSAYGSDGQEFTDDLMLYLFQTLREADVPWDGDVSLICDPSTLVDMLKWDKIVASQYGSIGSTVEGKIGKNVYGAMVRVTNNLTAASTGSYGVLAHKKAIGGVSQMEPTWVKEYEDLHLRRYSAETLYGVSELRNTYGIPFYTHKA